MADGIIKEWWKIKDGIARECGSDIDALAAFLKTKRIGRKQGEDPRA